MSEILAPTEANLTKIVHELESGFPVALPTETVYGLAGNAFDENAVLRIFSYKQRPKFDPLIVHVSQDYRDLDRLQESGLVDLSSWSQQQRALARMLAEKFWPGALTLLFPRGPKISTLVTADLPHVALRMPANDIFQDVLGRLHFPLAAPSANKFMRTSPTNTADVLSQGFSELKYIAEGGDTDIGLESTVVRVTPLGALEILRPGGVCKEQLSQIASTVEFYKDGDHLPHAPGMLKVHYAPSKPAYLFEDFQVVAEALAKSSKALLLMATDDQLPLSLEDDQVRVLSRDGSDTVAAKNLFRILNEYSRSDYDMLFVERPKLQSGLWAAVHDKLSKACRQWP